MRRITVGELQDKISLVTGGARRIGREIALSLARAGCHLGIHYRTSGQEAEDLVGHIRGLGCKAIAVRADLAQPEELAPLVARVCDEFGGVDILVNNASSFAPTDWGASQAEDWLDHLRVNFLAPVLLAQACWPIFQQRGGGHVINLTDIFAGTPLPSHAAYSASKAALACATQSLARLMAPTVRVNAVAPGVGLFPAEMSARATQEILGRVPLGRAGTPADVAAAVLFLLRDGDYVTGQTLVVDGGRSSAW